MVSCSVFSDLTCKAVKPIGITKIRFVVVSLFLPFLPLQS